MKKILSVILALLVVFSSTATIISNAEIGSTYYVDSVSGNDLNNGMSPSSPWKTLAKVSNTTFSEGDKILLKAGDIFTDTLTAKGNGTAKNPVTVSYYGDISTDGRPVITNNNDVVLINIHNVKGWVIDNMELTAPNGKGIYVTAGEGFNTEDIIIKNCSLHNIYYKQCPHSMNGNSPVMLANYGEISRLNNITIKDCIIYDCAYGIAMSGLSREWSKDVFVSPEVSYNKNYTIDGVSFNNILYDAVIIMSIYGMTIRNCSLINTSLNDDYYTAPMWSHHASNFVIENCEIAGARNEKDGMSVDFDGWTTDATYQYIYSHDNVRFVRNCCYDSYTKNRNCTVRYCLSVNDNKGENQMSQMLTTDSLDYDYGEKATTMENYKFYNNTVINCSEFNMYGLENAFIANNIFTGNLTSTFNFERKNTGDDGKKYMKRFTGVFDNNCFYGTSVPLRGSNNFFSDPGFVGKDITDKNSFRLAGNSSLIGKGIQVEQNMGEKDFYGNKLTDVHNIGCYDSTGENVIYNSDFLSYITAYINSILGTVYNFINEGNNKYWLF